MQSLPTPKIKSERWLDFCLRNMGPVPDINMLADFLGSHFRLIGETEKGSLSPTLSSAPRGREAARLQGWSWRQP